MTKIHRGSITKINGIVQEKNITLKEYRNNSINVILKNHLRNLNLSSLIEFNKGNFYQKLGNKLDDTQKMLKYTGL